MTESFESVHEVDADTADEPHASATSYDEHVQRLRAHGALNTEHQIENFKAAAEELKQCPQTSTREQRVAMLRPDDTRALLDMLFENAEGVLYGENRACLVAVSERRSSPPQHFFNSSRSELSDIAMDSIMNQAMLADDNDVMHVAVIPTVLGNKRSIKTGHISASEENARAVLTVIVEADEGNTLQAYARLRELGLLPTIEVMSGGINDDGFPKMHLYFVLEEPAKDVARVKRVNARLASLVGSDKSFASIVHPIRLPGGLHRKGATRPSRIMALRQKRFSMEEIEAVLDEAAPEKKQEYHRRQSADEKIENLRNCLDHIEAGRDGIRAVMLRYCGLSLRAGWDAADTEAQLADAIQKGHRDGNIDLERYNKHMKAVPQIVCDVFDKFTNTHSFARQEDRREHLAELRELQEDSAKRSARKAEIGSDIEKLTRASIGEDGDLASIHALINDVAMILPNEIEQSVFADHICSRLERKLKRQIASAIKKATGLNWGRLKRSSKPKGEVDDDRPLIYVSATDHDKVTVDFFDAMRSYNAKGSQPRVYRTAGGLGRLASDLEGATVIESLEFDTLANEAKGFARFRDDEHDEVDRAAPISTLRDVLADRVMRENLPKLTGIMRSPRFGPDARVLDAPGYHSKLGKLYVPVKGFALPPLREAPTEDDVDRALALLRDELLEGFAFRDLSDPARHDSDTDDIASSMRRRLYGQASRANALALFLQPFVRALIRGRTPMFAISKPKNREGVSLLTSVFAIVTQGCDAAMLPKPKSDEEMAKTLASKLEAGAENFIIDNVSDYLSSPSLASAITAPVFEGRALGTNRMIRGVIDWTWIVNGKNLQLASELSDRSVLIRLNSGKPRPELRDDFKHQDLMTWARDKRADLVWACLVLVQNWVAQGMPRANEIRFGGFDEWAAMMGGILRAAGMVGFMSNRADLDAGGGNRERSGITQFLTAWDYTFGDTPVAIGDPNNGELGDKLVPGAGGLLRLIFEDEISLVKGDGSDMDLSRSIRSAQTLLADWLLEQKDGPHEIIRRWQADDGTRMRRAVIVVICATTERDLKGRERARWRLRTVQLGPSEVDD